MRIPANSVSVLDEGEKLLHFGTVRDKKGLRFRNPLISLASPRGFEPLLPP
jgi:hypothetical protein